MKTENPAAESQKNGFQCPADNMNSSNVVTISESDGKSKSLVENSEIESFYHRLYKLHNSSGLNLVFDLRQTTLDLHRFYKEVTERGGFIQVTTDERWGEVALALKLDGDNQQGAQPLMKLYALFLYQYEQLYYYREPVKAASSLGRGATPITRGHVFFNFEDSSAMEKKCGDNSSKTLPNLKDALVEKKMPKENLEPMLIGSTSAEQKQFPQLRSKNKEMKKRIGAPRGTVSAYHIFIKRECERLRSTTEPEKLKGQRVRDVADNAWRSFSDSEKQPYIDESKKVKEKRRAQKVAADEENQSIQNAEVEKKPSPSGDDHHHVVLQPETEKSCVENQASVDLPEDLVDGIDRSK